MINNQDKITLRQFIFFIIQCQIGFGILILPHRLHVISKGGGWISTLIAGLLIQMIILLMWLVMKRFPEATIYEILTALFGDTFGKILSFSYTLFFIFVGMAVMLNSCILIRKWILPTTPYIAILTLFLFSGCYLAYASFKGIVRFNVLVSILIVPMIILVANGFFHADFSYISPSTEAGWKNIFWGSVMSRLDMGGFEMFLLVYPWVKGSSTDRLMAISITNAFVTIFYTFVVWMCFVSFSPKQIELIPEPVVYLLRSLPMGIVDRTDLIFIPLWMTTIVAFIGNYLYASSVGISYIFNLNNQKRILPILGILLFIITCFVDTPKEVSFFTKLPEIGSFFFTLILPTFFLFYSILKSKKGLHS
ncbi:GerAB/ArcD/ProY family transporter [Bacillus mycoides]|uniref:GerAB/ArcD/ProY family transporter n=1 Tax=Bacillus mycoides TaxID=1405 RepID=UPI0011A9DBAA|nr:GerAB/ArcD/ProY family transporter [Bacillus mycoides]